MKKELLMKFCSFGFLFITAMFSVSAGTDSPKLLNRDGSLSVLKKDGKLLRWEKSNALGFSRLIPAPPSPVKPETEYDSTVIFRIDSFVNGAILLHDVVLLDAEHRETGRPSPFEVWSQLLSRSGVEQKAAIRFKTGKKDVFVRPELSMAGNPLALTILGWELKEVKPAPLFRGVYDKKDPSPENQKAVLEEMSHLKPAEAAIIRKGNRPFLSVNGKTVPFNGYKGEYDYKAMSEAGIRVILTFNNTANLYSSVDWDKAAYDPVTGKFDFSGIEKNLIRIYHSFPGAAVILAVNCDPNPEWLEAHPGSIFCNEKGIRGKKHMGSFRGFSNAPRDPKKVMDGWAHSYTSEEYQKYVEEGLSQLIDFLRKTPAGNIVIGFQIMGGHDGQFVQWEYGDFNGHFDYSESNRKALCAYLREVYGAEKKLREAWGDPSVTFETVRNPSVAEYRKHFYFDDRPGAGRKLADCRRFISIGTARMLNRWAKFIKARWQRPSVIETWYSSVIFAQPGRLSLDELIKDEAINIVGMVSYYHPMRQPGFSGASANANIDAFACRNVLYIQELDHRTWRTQQTGGSNWMSMAAIPGTPAEFRSQLLRDTASTIAAGGSGFYLYDMFGSWYHAPEALEAIRICSNMNDHATLNAGKFPPPEVAVFMDEKTRTMSESVGEGIFGVWQTSGITPALHYLSDITRTDLPDYKLMVVMSPLTLSRGQLYVMKRHLSRKGNVLWVIGDAGRTSLDFSGTTDVLARLGLKTVFHPETTSEEILIHPDSRDSLVRGTQGRLGGRGLYFSRGDLQKRLMHGFISIDDPEAQILGAWERSLLPGFAVKRFKNSGTLIYSAKTAAITPSLLHNAAVEAGIQPNSEPGNAVFVGYGVAGAHRLTGPVKVVFPREVDFFDAATGKPAGRGKVWEPALAPAESGVILWLPAGK